MKNLYQKPMLVLTMSLMGACDETMMEESDASTPESCVLYFNPDADPDAGNGESEASPLSSLDSVVSKAYALKCHSSPRFAGFRPGKSARDFVI